MKRLLALVAALFWLASPAAAQNVTVKVVTSCGAETLPTTTPNALRMDATGKLCTAASVSATVGGFTPNGSYANLTATASTSASTALPTGATVRITNLGAGTVSCTFATGAATGVVNNTTVGPSSSVSRVVGSFDHIACIDQTGSSGSQLVVIEGGSGLGNDTGGGGGGSGGGAITAASGSYASGAMSSGSYAAGALAAGAFAAGAGVDGWDLTQGAIADAAVTAGATGSISAKLRSISRDITNKSQFTQLTDGTNAAATYTGYGTAPTGNVPGVNAFVTNTNANGQATAANSSPVVLPAAQVTADPCSLGAKTNLPISFQTTSITQQIALSGSTKIYVCSLSLIASAATVFSITGGTGTNCGTPAALIGTTSATHGLSLAANGGLTLGNGAGTVAVTGAGSELCIVQSGAGDLVGNLTYVQQ